MHIYLLRHSITIHDKERNIKNDNKDYALSVEGIAQTKKLKKKLLQQRLSNFIRVYVAPDKRCRQTASILFPKLKSKFIIVDDLREINKGFNRFLKENHYLGDMTIDKWELLYNNSSASERNAFVYPSGESINKLYRRVVRTFVDILKENNGQDLLIVSHNGPIRAIISYALGSKDGVYRSINIMNGAYSEVIYEKGKFTLVRLNNA